MDLLQWFRSPQPDLRPEVQELTERVDLLETDLAHMRGLYRKLLGRLTGGERQQVEQQEELHDVNARLAKLRAARGF